MKKFTLILLTLAVTMVYNAYSQEYDATSNTIHVSFASPKQEVSPVIKPVASNYVPGNPRYYALLIAEDDYEDPTIPTLTTPIQDADSLKKVLTQYYTFSDSNIVLLQNPPHDSLEEALENLSYKITDNDNLLIFYAGHGYWDKINNIGYWLPSDAADLTRNNKIKWFRNSSLVEDIRQIHSKHTLLISDSCFGGSIFKTRGLEDNTSKNIFDMYKLNSREALTSGNLGKVPAVSVFMKYLLKTLEENNNKYLAANAIYSQILIPVENNSETAPQFGIIPNVDDEGGNFIFEHK